jgi:hypothetical protein
MKRFLLLAAVTVVAAPALAADVGVSVNIGQPGFYGRIDIGNFPPPQVIHAQPIVIQPARVYVEEPEPIYLRVPPGHQRNWRKFCHRYDACGQPVYFVRDDWYEREYLPRYREERRGEGGHGDEGHRGDEHGHRHGDDRDRGRDRRDHDGD